MNDILDELNKLKADYSAAQTLLDESNAAKTAFDSTIADKNSAIANLTAALAAKDLDLAAKADAITGLQAQLDAFKASEKTAEEKAVEIVASQGIKPMKADHSAPAETKTREEVIAEWQALTNPVAKANYYFAHKAILFGN